MPVVNHFLEFDPDSGRIPRFVAEPIYGSLEVETIVNKFFILHLFFAGTSLIESSFLMPHPDYGSLELMVGVFPFAPGMDS